jgi:hypothetical protein
VCANGAIFSCAQLGIIGGGDLPLQLLHDVFGPRESHLQTVAVQLDSAPRVVEVQMCEDDQIDVSRREPLAPQARDDRVARLCGEQHAFFVAELGAVTGVDQDVLPARLHQEAVCGLLDAVVLIDRHHLRPQGLGDDAEHCPAVGAELPAGDGRKLKVAEPHAVSACFSPSSSIMISRMRNFWIFPVTVCGNSFTTRTYLGTL